jgi:hypothetical protein
MKRIGVLFGSENSFPSALVEYINARNVDGIRAEFVMTGAVQLNNAQRYSVMIDRISHEIPFYRSFLKNAALHGTIVINNPFWLSADDKFLNYALAQKLGVPVPPTVLLPHKNLPQGTTDRSVRNLEYPLDWDAVFAYVGEHGFLKPIDGGGWRDVYEVHGRDEFFRAYDQSRDLCMMYQKAVNFNDYFRCYVVARKRVRVMAYDPRLPHTERYIKHPPRYAAALLYKIEQNALKLCRALGYDINTVEFGVERGVPYAIDFMNPVPDADLGSVGEANFRWIVRNVAELAIVKARLARHAPALRWADLLGTSKTKAGRTKKRATVIGGSPAAHSTRNTAAQSTKTSQPSK